jgi:hypothetical protein
VDELHDPAPDEALGSALDALDPAARECVRLIEAAALSGEWHEAMAAIEALANSASQALEAPLLASLLSGAAAVGARLPVGVSEPSQQPPPPPPVTPPTLPLARRAAESLRAKNLVTPDRYRQLSDEARTRALAVAGVVREQALTKLQPLLEEQAAAPSLASFRRRLREEGLADAIAGQHVETAFRDAVQAAYADGMDRLLEDPLVGDAFPFVERLPIRDSRLSKACAWASRAGINGTGIYRRLDPAWRIVRPPSHHNCRCGTNPLTREMAAARGVTAARDVTLPDLLVKLLRR